MLRPYQTSCLEAILHEYVAGCRHQLVILATGAGKTLIAAHLPELFKTVLPGKMLFVAHRNELLMQTIDKLHTWAPSLKVGLEKAEKHADPDSDVIVASIASVGRSGSTRLDHFWDDISLIVVDEAHHSCSDLYRSMLEDSGVLKEGSTKLLLGLTATPRRRNLTRAERKETLLDDEDIISLKSIFQKITFTYPIKKAIKDGFLVPLKGYRVSTQVSLDDVKVTAGDFQVAELSNAVNTSERNNLVVKAWKEQAEGRQTVCFTCDIQHAKDLSEAFMRNGVMSQPIYGDDPQRAEKLKLHESGQIMVLNNCALLCEGYDSPSVSCIVLARPTRSSSLMTQQVGRGTRLHPGKNDCIIIDVCDATKKNSLVTFPSLLGLNPAFDLRGESVTKVAEQIEELQEKNPGVPFNGLTDLSKVRAYVESFDLFADPYPTEVKELSKLTWLRQADGSYIIHIPEEQSLKDQYWRHRREALVIAENTLGEFELSITSVDPEKKLGVFSTLLEAFTTADEVLMRCRPNRVKLMQRSAPWHDGKISDASKKYLRKLVGKRFFPRCLCPVGAGCDGVAGTVCATCGKVQMNAGEGSRAITRVKSKGVKL